MCFYVASYIAVHFDGQHPPQPECTDEFRDINELQKTHLTDMRINLDPYKLRKQIDAKLKAILSRLR